MAEFRPGYDAATKWTPPPDWRTAALEGDGWAARPAPPLSRLLVSGDIAAAMADLAPAGKDVGLWQICGDAAYALRIGHDRALIVSSTQSDAQTGWNPHGYAVSPANDGWMALDIAGPAMRELVAEMTVADLEASRSYYRDVLGLEELAPRRDPRLDISRYPLQGGQVTVTLRHFDEQLPSGNGRGGLQYVVRDLDEVTALLRSRGVEIDREVEAMGVKSVWTRDPDGVTNYFAETPLSRSR